MTALQELIDYNVFSEYKGLAKRVSKHSSYDKGRFLLYEALIDMVRFDKDMGDIKINMNDEEKKYWDNIDKKIKKAGKCLNLTNSMDDSLLWSFIPKRYHSEISLKWDGIGGWRD